MKYEIAAQGEQVRMAAEGLAHAALDAVALMRFAEDLAGSEAYAGCGGGRERTGGRFERLRGQKPAHGSRLAFASGRIGSLVVGMLAQAEASEGLPAGLGLGLGLDFGGRDIHEVAGLAWD